MKIDSSLIKRCKSKERSAQSELYRQLLPYLAGVCKRYLIVESDVNDALQETFINIFKNLEKYDDQRAQFHTWCVRIAINASLKLNEKHARRRITEFEDELHSEAVSPTVLGDLSREDLLRLIKKMPEKLLQVFHMHVVDEFDFKEISEILKINQDSCRQRLSRARKWVRERIDMNDKQLDSIGQN